MSNRPTHLLRIAVVVTALATIPALAAPPAALADSGSISDIRLTGQPQGPPLQATFSASRDCQPGSCNWFPVATRTAGDNACMSWDQPIWVGPNRYTSDPVSETSSFFPERVGTNRFCMYIYYGSAYHLVADVVYDYQPPAPPPPPTPAAHTDPIPGWIAHRSDSYHFDYFYVNDRVGPSYIDPTRGAELAQRSAARWGISYLGSTTTTPGLRDGQPVVGFSYSLPAHRLGEATEHIQHLYRRGKRRCRKVRRHGRKRRVCRRGKRRYAGWRIVDQDIEINARVPWQQGPYYPDSTQFDLETVLIHEFGHFAGNDHVFGCQNSPLVDAMDTGDWWRSPTDWHFGACALSTQSNGSRRSPRSHRGTFVTRRIKVPDDWKPSKRALGPGTRAQRP